MLTRNSEIRSEIMDWETSLRPLADGTEACDTIPHGHINPKGGLDAALEADEPV